MNLFFDKNGVLDTRIDQDVKTWLLELLLVYALVSDLKTCLADMYSVSTIVKPTFYSSRVQLIDFANNTCLDLGTPSSWFLVLNTVGITLIFANGSSQ